MTRQDLNSETSRKASAKVLMDLNQEYLGKGHNVFLIIGTQALICFTSC